MKESYEWTEDDLLYLIDNGEDHQESTRLDYKACDALQKTPGKKIEVSKDVSSFANSDSGTIVYGIIEEDHVPKRLDQGYDQNEISKEWLEQVINSNIHPKIAGLRIQPVHLASTNHGRYAYVVWIPQGNTAHQAGDKRYYKRYNFESVAMEDYEVRLVMFRSKHPILELTLEKDLLHPRKGLVDGSIPWKITLTNTGEVAAHNFAVEFELPKELIFTQEKAEDSNARTTTLRLLEQSISQKRSYVRFRLANIPEAATSSIYSGHIAANVLFPSYEIQIVGNNADEDLIIDKKWLEKQIMFNEPVTLYWRIFADDASARKGEQEITSDLSY